MLVLETLVQDEEISREGSREVRIKQVEQVAGANPHGGEVCGRSHSQ